MDITFKAPKALIETLMPHESFTLDVPGDEVYCRWSCRDLGNLGWLGKRSYKTFGLVVSDVVVKGKTETIRGDFQLVLYESMSDPVTSGREELGTSKLFGTLDEEVTDESYDLKAGWEGFTFGEVHVTGLKDVDIKTPKPKVSFGPSEGILHYKYIPATGRPGFADVEYPCFTAFSPPVAVGKTTKLQIGSNTTFKFDAGDWQKLPTMHHIISVIEKLEILEVVDARLNYVVGAGDLSNCRAVN